MFSSSCKFNRSCKNKDGDKCNKYCYPFVLLHGQNGTSGFWTTTKIPNKYKDCLIENLPIKEENPKIFEIINKYVSNILYYVEEKGIGLFMFSIPNPDNKFGTGTGKTTTAATLINEYVLEAVREHLKGKKELKHNPAIFIKMSELQNKYNAQFRGSYEMQQEASNNFYMLKNYMKNVNLLAIDDIGVRDTTEAFRNELFEIVDHRATEGKATVFTSNYPIEKIGEYLGERIASRIEGMCYKLGFKGKDFRKGGLF